MQVANIHAHECVCIWKPCLLFTFDTCSFKNWVPILINCSKKRKSHVVLIYSNFQLTIFSPLVLSKNSLQSVIYSMPCSSLISGYFLLASYLVFRIKMFKLHFYKILLFLLNACDDKYLHGTSIQLSECPLWRTSICFIFLRILYSQIFKKNFVAFM